MKENIKYLKKYHLQNHKEMFGSCVKTTNKSLNFRKLRLLTIDL